MVCENGRKKNKIAACQPNALADFVGLRHASPHKTAELTVMVQDARRTANKTHYMRLRYLKRQFSCTVERI